MLDISIDDDGIPRCSWGYPAEYRWYHDDEWGRPVVDDRRIFEKLCLEGFQSGLSWLTILRKRENFRRAFAGFEIDTVAAFDEPDMERLLGDAGIVRHRGKIEAAIGNARAAKELRQSGWSLAALIWQYEPVARRPAKSFSELPTSTAESTALSKDLRKRGFRFVGPTTVYSAMQALGVVNDHLLVVHPEQRSRLSAPRSCGHTDHPGPHLGDDRCRSRHPRAPAGAAADCPKTPIRTARRPATSTFQRRAGYRSRTG